MRTSRSLVGIAALLAAACTSGEKKTTDTTAAAGAAGTAAKCPAGDSAQLTLPSGFCASVFADSIGKARDLVVAPNGVIYVTLENMGTSTEQKVGGQPQTPSPRGVAVMRDANGDGKADSVSYFGDRGETGIAIYSGHLYVDQQDRIVRWPLDSAASIPTGKMEVVVSGIPAKPGHLARNFTIDQNGTLYLNVGSATNACQYRTCFGSSVSRISASSSVISWMPS